MNEFLQDPDRKTTNVVEPSVWKAAMRKNGQYNDDIFIQLTAKWLNRDIIILPWNKDDSPLDPFVRIKYPAPKSKGQFYLLYYPETLVGTFGSHYQSILPLPNFMKESEILDTNPISNKSIPEKNSMNEINKIVSSVGNTDDTNDAARFESDVTFLYTKGVIEEFTKIATKHKDAYGTFKPLLAYLAGYIIKDSDSVYGTELIFPEQHCFVSRIHDEGIYDADRDIEYDSLNWILSKSWTAKMCSNTRIKKTTIVARITSIMKGKRLPSHELHSMYNLEKRFGHVHGIVVEIDQEESTSTTSCVYTLSEMGRKQVEKCPKSYVEVHDGCDRPEFYQSADWVEGRDHVKILDFENTHITFDANGWMDKEHYADIGTIEDKDQTVSEIDNQNSNVSSNDEPDLDFQFYTDRHKKKNQIMSSDDDEIEDNAQHGNNKVYTESDLVNVIGYQEFIEFVKTKLLLESSESDVAALLNDQDFQDDMKAARRKIIDDRLEILNKHSKSIDSNILEDILCDNYSSADTNPKQHSIEKEHSDKELENPESVNNSESEDFSFRESQKSRKRRKSSDEKLSENENVALPSQKILKESCSEDKCSEGEKFVCEACNKFSGNLKHVIKQHLNRGKRCRAKYDANKEMMETLKNRYQNVYGLELFTCVGCDALHSLQNILTHINRKDNDQCNKKYESTGELEILNKRIQKFEAQQKQKQHKKDNAKSNAKSNPNRSSKAKPENQQKCLNCGLSRQLLMHLSKSKDCHQFYCEHNLLEKLRYNRSLKKFNQTQELGLDYICVCCNTIRFRKTVQEVTDEIKALLSDTKIDIPLQEKFKFDGKFWIHHNCAQVLKKGKMPNICYKNHLWIKEIPEVFKEATEMEKLAIKKKIPFIKMRDLPSSRMKYMKPNRVVNVPISDSDVLKTAMILPRGADKLATVNVAVKRELKSKWCYKGPELVRPHVINEMLRTLKHVTMHKSYVFFPYELLDTNSKYKFIKLPLVGEQDVSKKLFSLEQAFEKLVPPILSTLKLKIENVLSQDANCFLNTLMDQCR